MFIGVQIILKLARSVGGSCDECGNQTEFCSRRTAKRKRRSCCKAADHKTPAFILPGVIVGAAALLLVGCSSAANSGSSAVASGSRPTATPAVPSGQCARAEASVTNIELLTVPYLNVRTSQDLANAAAEIANSPVGHDDSAQVVDPVEAAAASMGGNSALGTMLTSVLLSYNEFSTIIVTAGSAGGATTAEVSSDARDLINDIAMIKKVCS